MTFAFDAILHNVTLALNSETYISLRHEESRTSKNIGYEFYCEKPIVVKHKSEYSCKSAIYLNLGFEIIKEKFLYYFNKTDIKLSVVDGGKEIILANWASI